MMAATFRRPPARTVGSEPRRCSASPGPAAAPHTAAPVAWLRRAGVRNVTRKRGRPPNEAATPWAGVRARKKEREGRTTALVVLPSPRAAPQRCEHPAPVARRPQRYERGARQD